MSVVSGFHIQLELKLSTTFTDGTDCILSLYTSCLFFRNNANITSFDKLKILNKLSVQELKAIQRSFPVSNLRK